jgi:monoamine oxidase
VTDVVVIGAGMAGAATADLLARAGASVVVLEARGRLGGRLWTRQGPADQLVDVGGQWVGPGQDRVLALIDELELQTIAQPTDGANLLATRGKVRRYRGTIPPLSPHRLVDLQLLLRKLDRLAAGLDPAAPWNHPDAGWLDAVTVAAWLKEHARTAAAAELVRFAVHAVYAVELDQLSMLTLLAYARAAGGFMPLFDVEGGAQERRIVGGAQQLVSRVMDRAVRHGADLRLGTEVTAIEWSPGGATAGGVTVRSTTGTVHADRAVITVPPALIDRIAFDPVLPGPRTRLQARMPMGSAAKIHLVWDRPFWRDDGLSGESVTDGGPLRMTFDATSRSGSPGILVGFALADQAAAFSALAPDAQRAAVTAQVRDLFGPAADSPVAISVQDWCSERFSGGCYVGLATPGTLSRYGTALRAPVGPLHWAGTETATAWTGYIDGALQSAERAAAEILAP